MDTTALKDEQREGFATRLNQEKDFHKNPAK